MVPKRDRAGAPAPLGRADRAPGSDGRPKGAGRNLLAAELATTPTFGAAPARHCAGLVPRGPCVRRFERFKFRDGPAGFTTSRHRAAIVKTQAVRNLNL